MTPLRLATVPYVNAAPLLWGFRHGSLRDRCTVVAEPPARIPGLLLEDRIDAGLVPIIAAPALARAGIAMLPSPGVASRRTARSVLLVSRRPLGEVRSVALDRASRTSQALVRILLAERGLGSIRYAEQPAVLATMLRDHDAALIIGDPALAADTRGLEVLDLAEAWHALTGLPFVFAAWAVRPGAAAREPEIFERSLDEGLAQIETIARASAAELGLETGFVAGYLRENIHYRLGPDEARAAALFLARAREHGLIDAAAAAPPGVPGPAVGTFTGRTA